MVVGEQLRVALRRGEHVATSTTLFESTLAPVLFFFAPWVAVAGVALAQGVGAALRRTGFTKGFFAVAQWSLATSVGALVLAEYTPEGRTST
jgi:hypothetical protein